MLMLEPDIGKGRQIKELIIVILKFGEIEKETNAMLASYIFVSSSASESPRQLQHTAAVSNNSSRFPYCIGSFTLTTPLSCVR